MKKIYQKPETRTVKITSSMMLAASDPKVTLDETESIDGGVVESRHQDFWYDEEEEE